MKSTHPATLRLFGAILACVCLLHPFGASAEEPAPGRTVPDRKLIKYVDFDASYQALCDALALDVATHEDDIHLRFHETLAYLAAKYGGSFKGYKKKDLDELAVKLQSGKTWEELTSRMKHWEYYLEAYSAVLSEFVGSYGIRVPAKDDPAKLVWVKQYGLKNFSPIAAGYGYSHYDDFGSGRSYGFKRKHLGHDMMAAIGAPVVAVESGRIEVMGWNMYGGWRIGIRSFDRLRYYYYAHLRQNRPFREGLKEGDIVRAGDVIGYVGRTGYSAKENVNNINVNHLHFGMQLVFDESQKECNNEIWIDTYALVRLLERHRSEVVRDEETREQSRKFEFTEDSLVNEGMLPEF